MSAYVYINSESGLWTVGFYRPDGTRYPESDHSTPESAAERVHYLNGGGDSEETKHSIALNVREAREEV